MQKKKVVIAVPDGPFRSLLQAFIERSGHGCAIASDARSAGRLMSYGRAFVLALVDLDLPDAMQVIAVARQRKTVDELRILGVASEVLSPQEVQQLNQAGAQGFISPATPIDNLVTRLNSLLFTGTSARSAERFPVRTDVAFRHGSETYYGEALNISAGGMFIRTPDLLPRGASIVVWVKPEGFQQHVEVRAEVRWNREAVQIGDSLVPPGIGVQFASGDPNVERLTGGLLEMLVAAASA